jgi:hypothetical protein
VSILIIVNRSIEARLNENEKLSGIQLKKKKKNAPLDDTFSPNPGSRSQMAVFGWEDLIDQSTPLVQESFHLDTQVQDTIDSWPDTPGYINSNRYKDENMPRDCCSGYGYEISDVLKPVCHRSLRSER